MSEVIYEVPQVKGRLNVQVELPGSKSITNRVLLAAALADRPVRLRNVLFSDDSRHLMECLHTLGFKLDIDESVREVTVFGQGGQIPNQKATINVGSAGTAARFLTAMLAFGGGEYLVESSKQMMSRPMKPLLDGLRQLGVKFEFLGQPDCLPFRVDGSPVQGGRVLLRSNISSQFLSAVLLAGCLSSGEFIIEIDGDVAAKPYIEMTLAMMRDFGVTVENQSFQRFIIPAGQHYQGLDYAIEPDVSNASYFWAMAALTGGSVLVKGVKFNSLQGDIGILEILKQLGCSVAEKAEGIEVRGPAEGQFPGIEADLSGMPDQTMTLAALAPFASSPTRIKNVGIIKFHESNRIRAILNELGKMGIRSEETDDGLIIYPGTPTATAIETYDDHRMAMAFSLIGLRTPGMKIKNPGCTGKTFEGYFEYLDRIVAGMNG